MNIKEFALILISLTIISCGRNLQSDSDLTIKDKCSSVKATKISDCFDVSANSNEDNCCSITILNRLMCKNFNEKSEITKSLESFGGIQKMNVFLTTNLLGSAEVQCSNQNKISDDVKTLANNCGNFNNPSVDGCAAFSNENVQCCFSSSFSKLLGNTNMEACAGIVAPIKMPSFSMKTDGDRSSLLCGVNSNEKTLMESCGDAQPENEADCTKFTRGDVECVLASYEKAGANVKVCVGKKGDIEMMKELGIEPRLRTVTFNQLNSENTGFDRIGFSYTFYLSFIIFFLF